MKLHSSILEKVVELVQDETGQAIGINDLIVNPTRKEFTGDYTLLVFPLVRYFKKSPEETAKRIGDYLVENLAFIRSYNVIKGFLNLEMNRDFWVSSLDEIQRDDHFGSGENKGQTVLVEFSSPNTNKPLHLGHIRNILLGWSVSSILEFAGYKVIRTQVINDRGIAVCKSMLAWQKYGKGETPESSGMKGDHLVGKYYVVFDQKLKDEYIQWQETDVAGDLFRASGITDRRTYFESFKNEYFNQHSLLGNEAREMLIKWENKDAGTMELWNRMNGWVYLGFAKTYEDLGVRFDSNYYESDTYKLGKEIVEEGLKRKLFFREADGSIWIDLEDIKMDKKILLRSDGTALYITQDLGTADQRYQDHKATKMVYVVGDEQDYHFKVLFEIMKRLERPYANGLYHLSYGMVDLPSGKMKSREGTVVDADLLMQEVIDEARAAAESRAQEMEKDLLVSAEEIKTIALAALKFFIIKVNPQKRMVFNPEESLDMQGQTGPYVQNAYVRIKSIFRKAGVDAVKDSVLNTVSINDYEKELIATLIEFPDLIRQSADAYEPSGIANYCYELAKKLHKYYAEVKILSETDEIVKNFRLVLIQNVAKVLKSGMQLLGIEMVEQM